MAILDAESKYQEDFAELHKRLADCENKCERLKMEAQGHALEARAANATLAECYQVATGRTGEPGNWHGANPVRKRIAELETFISDWQEYERDCSECPDCCAGDTDAECYYMRASRLLERKS